MSIELVIFILLIMLRFVLPNVKKSFEEETRQQKPQQKPQLAEDTHSIESIKEEIRKMRNERAASAKAPVPTYDKSFVNPKPETQLKAPVVVKAPAIATKTVSKPPSRHALQPKRYFTPKPLLKSKTTTKYAAVQTPGALAEIYEFSAQPEATLCHTLRGRLSNLRESMLIKEVLDMPVCKRPRRNYNF